MTLKIVIILNISQVPSSLEGFLGEVFQFKKPITVHLLVLVKIVIGNITHLNIPYIFKRIPLVFAQNKMKT